MVSTYQPDRWVIVKLPSHYRVFGMWQGGYLDGDSWRLNSGITNAVGFDDSFSILGYSGSVYEVAKGGYGLTAYGSGVLREAIEKEKMVLLTEEEAFEYLCGFECSP